MHEGQETKTAILANRQCHFKIKFLHCKKWFYGFPKLWFQKVYYYYKVIEFSVEKKLEIEVQEIHDDHPKLLRNLDKAKDLLLFNVRCDFGI